MRNIDFSRLVFWLSGFLLVLLVGFAAGFLSYHKKNFAYDLVTKAQSAFRKLTDPAEWQRIALGWDFEHVQPARDQRQGVTVNERAADGALILMVGFFDGENQARLVTRDGAVVTRWSLDFFKLFPDRAARACNRKNTLGTDVHGAQLTQRGELVASFEYCGTVKLSACGDVLWTLSHQTHHSITPASAGGYWILGRDVWSAQKTPGRFPPFSVPKDAGRISEDLILRVSEDGEILERHSIPGLLYDSGLEALMTATGEPFETDVPGRGELVHANKIAELPASLADRFPMFEAGDLLISMRMLNLLAVLDHDTLRVKWHQTGPWLRQHDPEFRPDGTISVFNNNTYKTSYDALGHVHADAPPVTNILDVDPATGETRILYGQRPGQEFLSVIRGQHEILPDGGMLITDFDGGRVFEVDAGGRKVWEYANRYDEAYVGEITNAMRYDPSYFETEPGVCR